ncbi:MAG: hypothetical protein HWD58_00315 [Bacteroidota bacterium]|nr:MAG: hypothetical protein HWD58_00315 [Bacteroidota bacterium]
MTWITSQEIDNSHFIVERSRDGKSFSALSDKISSKGLNGNSQSILNYAYTDAYPINGHNYYRLHQEDLDGKVSYSQVVDVYFGNETQVSLYPNPVQNQLTLR